MIVDGALAEEPRVVIDLLDGLDGTQQNKRLRRIGRIDRQRWVVDILTVVAREVLDPDNQAQALWQITGQFRLRSVGAQHRENSLDLALGQRPSGHPT